jgi:exonuclease SbcD
VVIDDNDFYASAYSEINNAITGLQIRVLKVVTLRVDNSIGLEQLVESDRQLNELKPDEVFKKKCNEDSFDLDEKSEILDAFYEILNEVEER